MTLSGSARLAGVIGWPVTHSLSPALHGYWLAEHGIDGAYVPLAMPPEEFGWNVVALRRMGFRGVNVTVPHKEAAFALSETLDEEARIAGAVNLLVFGDTIEGHNTDIYGLSASLVDALGKDCLKGRNAAVLGAGGAARAAILSLAKMGAREIRIFNRTPQRAAALAQRLAAALKHPVTGGGTDTWPAAAADTTLVVHTTSAGLKGTASLDLALDGLPKDAAVCDIVYNPLETELLKRAKAAGFKTVDGLGMLMHQAVPSFAAFYGVTPKVTPALRQVLEKALGR